MDTRSTSSRDRDRTWTRRAAPLLTAGILAALLTPGAAAQDDARIEEAEALIRDAKLDAVDALGPADLPDDAEERLREVVSDLAAAERALALAEAEAEPEAELEDVADRIAAARAELEDVLTEPDLDAAAEALLEGAVEDLRAAEQILRGDAPVEADAEPIDVAVEEAPDERAPTEERPRVTEPAGEEVVTEPAVEEIEAPTEAEAEALAAEDAADEALACQDLTAEALERGDIRLTWTDTTEQPLAVFRASDGDFDRVATLDEDADTFVDDALEPGETARYAVAAADANPDAVGACPVVEVTAIPFLPATAHIGLALAGGCVALLVARRR